ncbi:MAG: hypothetical protein Kow0089_06420 [Desulfobulbaceae bacterium]
MNFRNQTDPCTGSCDAGAGENGFLDELVSVQKRGFSFEVKDCEKNKRRHIKVIFRALFFEHDAEIGRKDRLWTRTNYLFSGGPIMGKGDKRTKRGKIYRGTTGNSRPKARKLKLKKKQK